MTTPYDADRAAIHTLGLRLFTARQLRNLSQRDLTQRLGRSERPTNLIGRWERGKTIPTLLEVVDLAEALRVPVEWLLLGRGELKFTNDEVIDK